jgi:hypothetical protein
MIRLVLVLAFGLFCSAPAQAQRYADLFSVDGIEVDVVGPTAQDARVGAFREAARRAWPRLWDKLVEPQFRGQAPKLGDAALGSWVTAYDVANERMSATRYIARITVSFDPRAVRNALAARGAGFTGARSRAMLLLPLLNDGGAPMVYDPANAWAQAWARFPLVRSRIEYIRADSTLADRVLLSPQEVIARDPDRLRTVLQRYRADDVVLARAEITRSFPGGPVSGVFSAYAGSNPEAVTRFRLSRPSDRQLREMYDDAIGRLDAALSLVVRDLPPRTLAQAIGGARSFGGFTVDVITPDAAALQTMQARLSRVETVRGVSVAALTLGGTSRLAIAHSESTEMLLYALDQAGLRVDDRLLRDRLPSDVPIPRPKTAEELEAERLAAEGANGAQPAPAPAPAQPRNLLPPNPSPNP